MEANEPQTLQEAIVYFSDPERCLHYVVARRWPNGVVCPTCGSEHVSFLKNQLRWQCSSHHAKRQFSIKTGTIFEDSPLGLDKWLPAIWLITNCKNGVSSYEIHRALGVTQKTAWFMLHRIRLAHQTDDQEKLSGEVEADETFVGGRAVNMHAEKRKRFRGGRDRTVGKAVVMGVLERKGRIRASVIPDRGADIIQAQVRAVVEPGSQLFTDSFRSYRQLARDYAHQFVDHTERYVQGRVHTNGMENFWSLLKRGLHGTYVSVEPFHLSRYIDEQVFRYNHREDMNDADRFGLAVSQIVGKRLTLADLTGKNGQTATA